MNSGDINIMTMSTQAAPRRQIYAGYSGKDHPTEQERIVHFMQSYQASEGFNSSFLYRWIAASPNEAVKGGLRVVHAREGMHTRLLCDRLKELGETSFIAVAQERRDREVPFYGSTQISDTEKFARVLSIFEEPEYFWRPMTSLIAEIRTDLTSRELLRCILADEHATTEWFASIHAYLTGSV